MGCCSSMPPNLGAAPESFPKDIVAYKQFWATWAKDEEFKCDKILVAYPKNEQDVLAICRWAHEHEYRVRPTGQRHNWSPLTLGPNTKSDPPIVILDMRQHLNNVLSTDEKNNQITVQPGMLLGDLLENMEKVNMSFPHTPAPYDITVGGITAIDGHGTKIASAEEFKAGKTNNFGTVSNRVIKMRVVCYEEGKDGKAGQYILKDFTAKDPEFPALQCAVGRTLAVSITFQAVPQYYARCRSTFEILTPDLFPKPPQDAQGNFVFPDDTKEVGARFPAKSYAHYVDKFGAAEVIWFPWTDCPWLKVWNQVPKTGPGVSYSNYLDESCPFSVSDNVPKVGTLMIKSALGIKDDVSDFQIFRNEREEYTATVRKSCCGCLCGCCKDCCCPPKTPDSFPSQDDKDLYGDDSKSLRTAIADSLKLTLGFGMEGWGQPELAEKFGPVLKSVAEFGVQSEDVWDVWGPSKNTLLYVRTSTCRVTANGYAVWLPRRKLQLGIWLFVDLFTTLQDKYKAKKMYPANMPLEIRVTGPDYKDACGNNCSPYLSACTPDGVPQDILNDHPVILWLDNLTFPGSPDAPPFYAELEKALVEMYAKHGMFARPEWSKGWGYSADGGAYTNKWFLDHTRHSLSNWNVAIDALNKLDPKKLFSNSFWDNFMTRVNVEGSPASPNSAITEAVAIEDKIEQSIEAHHGNPQAPSADAE